MLKMYQIYILIGCGVGPSIRPQASDSTERGWRLRSTNLCPAWLQVSIFLLRHRPTVGFNKQASASMASTRESLLKGKDQYGWPPCTDRFGSAAFNTENVYFFFYKININEEVIKQWHEPGNPYWRGRISMVDLLVLTSSDQLPLLLKI
jgi:hypothetical protein